MMSCIICISFIMNQWGCQSIYEYSHFIGKKTSSTVRSLEQWITCLSSMYVIGTQVFSSCNCIYYPSCTFTPGCLSFREHIPFKNSFIYKTVYIWSEWKQRHLLNNAWEDLQLDDYFQSQETRKDANDPACGHLRITSTQWATVCVPRGKKPHTEESLPSAVNPSRIMKTWSSSLDILPIMDFA